MLTVHESWRGDRSYEPFPSPWQKAKVLYTSPLCNNRNVHKGKEYACHTLSHHAYVEDGIPQLPFYGILLVTMDAAARRLLTALVVAMRGCSFITEIYLSLYKSYMKLLEYMAREQT